MKNSFEKFKILNDKCKNGQRKKPTYFRSTSVDILLLNVTTINTTILRHLLRKVLHMKIPRKQAHTYIYAVWCSTSLAQTMNYGSN